MEYNGWDNLETMKLAENYNNFLINEIVSRIRKEDNVIVDFGSGDGFFARQVGRLSDERIFCIEPAANMKKYYAPEQKVLDSLEMLPDGSVDFIYSLNVLEHIENDTAIAELFYKKMKPGGILYLYLPALSCLYSSMDRKVGHYRRYSKESLKHLLKEEKWNVSELRYADFLGFFATLAFKVFGNKNGNISQGSLKFYDRFIFPFSHAADKLTGGRVVGKNIAVAATRK